MGATPEFAAGMNAAPSNILAVISLILGVASWLGMSLLASVPAIITGHMARSDPNQEGRGMALAGLLLGYANISISAIALVIIVVLLF